jgi:hypothetical protein
MIALPQCMMCDEAVMFAVMLPTALPAPIDSNILRVVAAAQMDYPKLQHVQQYQHAAAKLCFFERI